MILSANCKIVNLANSYIRQNKRGVLSQNLRMFSFDNLTNEQKQKALEVLNNSDYESLSRYAITKKSLQKVIDLKESKSKFSSLEELNEIKGLTVKTAEKFVKSLTNDVSSTSEQLLQSKLRGTIVYPNLDSETRLKSEDIVTVHLTINSAGWTRLTQSNYELCEWGYHNLQIPEGKKLLMSDLFSMAWQIYSKIPKGDIYVMEAPVTMLRATGSDPQNPKVLTVNLQKAQLTAMIVALLNASRANPDERVAEELVQSVYFLRQSLSARLFRNLVGNERVSADNAVSEIISKSSELDPKQTHVHIPSRLAQYYDIQKDIDKETLGQCLLLSLTFMDLCVYRNPKTVERLVSK